MILDYATALIRDATAVHERERLSHQRALWNNYTDQLTKIRERLESAVGFLNWFSAAFGTDMPSFDPPTLAAAIRSVTDLNDTLQADPGAVLDGNQVPDTAAKVNALVNRLEEQARSVWSEHLDTDGWVPASLWTPFENCSTFGPAVRKAVQQDLHRKEFAKLAFPTADRQAAYEQLISDRAEILEDLPDTSDEEIRGFLVAAAGAGVPLAQYSAAVAEWLVQHGLADRYVIRTRA